MALTTETLKTWFNRHYDEILRDFVTFLEFPSISTDPAHFQDARRCAEWLKHYLTQIGLEATLWETPGMPVVYASYDKAGPECPTLLIYHHYDVQPVDPLQLWKNDPFKPAIIDNEIFARGSVDNKGQCFYTLTALKAFFQLIEKVRCNIKVFIEGEEESASQGTSAILEKRKNELKADHLLVVDFDIPAVDRPAVTIGMRGIVTMDVECSNAFVDLHSGMHGGIALNPNRALATLLARLWDETGHVAVPHFYDEVRPLPKKHREAIDMSFDKEQYQHDFGVGAFCEEEGHSLVEGNWLRPTLEINGMWGGYTGAGFKTVIPAKAYAKISCRLVPDQQPDVIAKRVAQFLQAEVASGIKIHTQIHQGAVGYRSSLDAEIVSLATEAFAEVFQRPCRYQLCGGSVPIVELLARASGAAVALIGVGLTSDGIHAPNEHFGLDRFEKGFLCMGRILTRLST